MDSVSALFNGQSLQLTRMRVSHRKVRLTGDQQDTSLGAGKIE